jgi:uncharacterized protein YndB with AHSA1/START domain
MIWKCSAEGDERSMEGDVVSSFRESVHIDAPPEAVWRLVSDVRRHPEFAGPKSITKAIDIDGQLEVGRRWIAHERFRPAKVRRAVRSPRWTRHARSSGSPTRR